MFHLHDETEIRVCDDFLRSKKINRKKNKKACAHEWINRSFLIANDRFVCTHPPLSFIRGAHTHLNFMKIFWMWCQTQVYSLKSHSNFSILIVQAFAFFPFISNAFLASFPRFYRKRNSQKSETNYYTTAFLRMIHLNMDMWNS